ncbi:virulence protein RhuM/Fic/DOC family protein [Thermoflavifilum thermophilum]|uniref:Fic/DOC family protein n=1 Tax=Thermoflavifilum thermophilum TaxID=1393122 RepID=A0A1I7NI39_9BACT|nr:virulence protein RhuM/Fic/DOC family protein [Thermoflavifilum thermophilum]SFV34322.1 Fic/DOC family protein [Thermoflavifilum thermophilum]
MTKKKNIEKKSQPGTTITQGMGGEVVIYEDPEHRVRVDVRLDQDTIWLSLNQIAALFERDKSVISRHLRNIYRERELDRESTVAFFATAQLEGKREVVRQVEYYNLDAIISVGYRVNSRRGTQFRIWATQVLRDHLVKGYTANARRLQELHQTIRVVAGVTEQRLLTGDEAASLLRLVRDYADSLMLLDDYDHGRLTAIAGRTSGAQPLMIDEAKQLIAAMKTQIGAGELFGREREPGLLEGILSTVFQTVLGQDAYPTLEEKAAHLLYFIVKDHPFVDGNKRIGAALFLRFLDKNQLLYTAEGMRRIADETIVALTLLLAESDAQHKEALTHLVVALLNRLSK